jgi:catechol 2,3-dioxygenase-like lactoylglutathione lyase family enzyme
VKQLDHIILAVNDAAASVEFYVNVLGFTYDGKDGPFSVVRACETFTIQLAPRGTAGGEHLAFAMTRAEFDDVFRRLREHQIAYGDAFDSVGTQRGPGDETGARGIGKALYFFDPNKHLLEIRHYERISRTSARRDPAM